MNHPRTFYCRVSLSMTRKCLFRISIGYDPTFTWYIYIIYIYIGKAFDLTIFSHLLAPIDHCFCRYFSKLLLLGINWGGRWVSWLRWRRGCGRVVLGGRCTSKRVKATWHWHVWWQWCKMNIDEQKSYLNCYQFRRCFLCTIWLLNIAMENHHF